MTASSGVARTSRSTGEGPRIAADRAAAKLWAGRRQRVRLAEPLERQRTRVQAGRQRGRDLGNERAAQPVDARRIGPVLAIHLRAIDLAREVQRQPVMPDADDVGGLPARRAVAEQAELLGQQIGLPRREVHVGVDAGHERLGDALGVGGIREPLAIQVAAEQHRARHAVALDVRGPEVLRHLAEPALAPEVHLPQPVARGDEALCGEGVVEPLGVDVRHAPFVHEHLDRALEAGHDHRRAGSLAGTAMDRSGEQQRDEHSAGVTRGMRDGRPNSDCRLPTFRGRVILWGKTGNRCRRRLAIPREPELIYSRLGTSRSRPHVLRRGDRSVCRRARGGDRAAGRRPGRDRHGLHSGPASGPVTREPARRDSGEEERDSRLGGARGRGRPSRRMCTSFRRMPSSRCTRVASS